MKIIKCTPEYASQILDIFNDAILNSTALYDYKPWTMDTMKVWFETKAQHNFPVIGIVDDEGVLMGFGSYGQFRMRPAYKYTIENSLYVHRDHRGKGLGKILLNEIISHATSQNFHSIIAVIDASNEISLDLHRKAGFTQVGVFREVGYKFGRWLDAAFLQLNLETPEMPEEGWFFTLFFIKRRTDMQKSHIIFEFYLFIELNVIVHNQINIVYLCSDKIMQGF